MKNDTKWLPLDIAAERFGYAHKESLSRRLRQLRRRGFVIDCGRPPAAYSGIHTKKDTAIVLMWPNPQTALLREDAPLSLLRSRRGRPATNS